MFGVRGLLRGEGLLRPMMATPEMAPLVAEIRTRMRDLEDSLSAFPGAAGRLESGTAARPPAYPAWAVQVIVVSNREPYIHENGPNGGS